MPEGFYEADGRKWYSSQFEPSWIHDFIPGDSFGLIDCGAFDGGDSRRFKIEFPNAQVCAIEPCPWLCDSMKPLEAMGVEVHNIALWSECGIITFRPRRCLQDGLWRKDMGSVYIQTAKMEKNFDHLKWPEDEIMEVPALTLAEFWRKNGKSDLQVLHLDMEGSEIAALKGIGDLRPRIIFMEVTEGYYDGAPTKPEIDEFMEILGYRLHLDLISDRLYLRK
jgi:FkbM family methyltransferase